jgi:hypothetical protein
MDLWNQVDDLIYSAKMVWKAENPDLAHDDSLFPKPLIRLRVDYTSFNSIMNPYRFGQQFVGLFWTPFVLL